VNKEIRLKVYNKYNGHCAYCGCKLEYKEMQVDHIIPIARGHSDALMKVEKMKRGKEDISNYNPSCRSCNFRKGMLDIEEFRQAIMNGLKVLERNFTYRLMHKYHLIEFGKSKVKFYFERKHK
jgi:5-methylcytosine-specific restriction endonuclease McrA